MRHKNYDKFIYWSRLKNPIFLPPPRDLNQRLRCNTLIAAPADTVARTYHLGTGLGYRDNACVQRLRLPHHCQSASDLHEVHLAFQH